MLEGQLRTSPGTVDTYLVLGKVYERLKDLEKARQCLETAVALDPLRPDVLYSMTTVSAKLGEEERTALYRAEFDRIKQRQLAAESKGGVREQVRDAVFLPRLAAEILRYAGRASRERGNAALAEKCLRQAAEVWPQEAEARMILAAIYEATERPEDALRCIRELKAIEPQNLEHVQNEAVLCTRLKRFEEAEAAFEELCRLAPERGAGYAGLAELYLHWGKKAERARALAEKSVELEPTGGACVLAATLAKRDGDLAAARKALQQAMALEPRNALYREMYESLDKPQ